MEGSAVLNTVQPMITTLQSAFTASDLVAIIGAMLPYAVGIVVVWIAFGIVRNFFTSATHGSIG